jgi:hypothetical protein
MKEAGFFFYSTDNGASTQPLIFQKHKPLTVVKNRGHIKELVSLALFALTFVLFGNSSSCAASITSTASGGDWNAGGSWVQQPDLNVVQAVHLNEDSRPNPMFAHETPKRDDAITTPAVFLSYVLAISAHVPLSRLRARLSLLLGWTLLRSDSLM